MKRILYLATISLAAMFIFGSCGHDDDIETTLSVTSPDEIVISGGTATFSITTDADWTVAVPEADIWITVDKASGTGNATITVTAEANTGEARSSNLTVKAGADENTTTVTVTQAGPFIEPVTVSVAKEGGPITFSVASNVSWNIASNDAWISALSPTIGMNTIAVSATVAANTGTARTGTITVTGTGELTATITIDQGGSLPEGVIFDDFEGHYDFELNSPGSVGWSYIDGDGGKNVGFADLDFPNEQTPTAAIIMNWTKVSPDTAGTSHSGEKYNAFWSVGDPNLWPNDDWFISPELSYTGTFKFAFWAKSYTVQYGAERLVVAYSTTGKTAADFTNVVSEGDYTEVPAEWTRYEYEIPAAARYVALHCVSQDAMFLMVDDVAIGEGNLPNAAPRTDSPMTYVTADFAKKLR